MTVGGASSGYCAIGIVGIASAPARMMTSEQTVARIGRRMKVSTNMTDGNRLSHGRMAGHCAWIGTPSPSFWMPETIDAVAGLEPADDDVVVAETSPTWTGRCRATRPLLLLLGDEAEVLPAERG